MNKTLNLENNLMDKIAVAVKSLTGFCPYIGTALGEIICYYIPNQKLDRIIKYLKIIDVKVDEISEELKNNKDKINLIETGFKSSANSTFDEKCEWIANIVLHGLSDDIEISIAENIIDIVSQLNYEQIVILYYHSNFYLKPWAEKEKFTNKFKQLLNFINLFSSDREKYDLLKNKEKFNLSTLMNLGLLENEKEIKKLPSFGISSSDFSRDIKELQSQLYELNNNLIDYFSQGRYRATDLGKLVIKAMSIVETSF